MLHTVRANHARHWNPERLLSARQQALSLGGGNVSSCPIPAIRDHRRVNRLDKPAVFTIAIADLIALAPWIP